ncbi:MAG TPA: pepsin/retropepsin-like aspartic protease family protein [Rhizomicrobium sp.]|nr:pepsin/retropepsin-like aspartic protease family protein [Rhizomicrobium sp.]
MRWLCLIAIVLSSAARAADTPPCQIGQVASLDAMTTPEGMIAIQGKVNGRGGRFLVDTGGLGGVLGFSPAFALKLNPQRAQVGGMLIGGARLEYGAIVKRFEAGPVGRSGTFFLIGPDRMLEPDTIGAIQPYLWRDLDVEIDFVKGKLNLFLQKQCPGRVVYWTHEAVAAVPMSVDQAGHITVKATLDGAPVDAVIDTGAQNSVMSLATAKALFGIDAMSPALKPLGTFNINNLVQARTYRYAFKSLTFEGIAVANPDIVISDTGENEQPALVVGIGALRQLHLFIAYDESLLYLTAAEAR